LALRAARRFDTDVLRRERPLADVIASYSTALQRERAGRYRAPCPFHEERTPSLWIDARDDGDAHYHRFGCWAQGDSITCVMERESCSFQDACERLATRERPPVVEASARLAPKSAGVRWEQLASDSTEAETLELALRAY
jgi:DNA primase